MEVNTIIFLELVISLFLLSAFLKKAEMNCRKVEAYLQIFRFSVITIERGTS